jgi:hypothetical protein
MNEIDRILSDYSDPKESESRLWRDLATWAFSRDPEIPADIPRKLVAQLLDDAAAQVKELKTATAWASAARYFQAENFHDLEGPAAARAVALKKGARAKKPAKKLAKKKRR